MIVIINISKDIHTNIILINYKNDLIRTKPGRYPYRALRKFNIYLSLVCHPPGEFHHTTAVVLINRHCQQREEDRASGHPQCAVPVPSFNHRLDDGEHIGKRHHQHNHRCGQQRRRSGFKDNKRSFQARTGFKERKRQREEQIR